jgi:REP element-mobilizing transposase RayT
MPINQKYLAKFESGGNYHIYNRSHSDKKMFPYEENYSFLLLVIKKYLVNYLDFYAYSLLPNHFHLFIQVKNNQNIEDEKINAFIVNQFKKLFIAYTNSFNKTYEKHGGIFSTPFRRIAVNNDAYFTQLIYYLHFNAAHHQLVENFEIYPYSSYKSILSDKPTLLQREKLLNWFGGRDKFIKYHTIQRKAYEKFPFYIE